MFSFKSMLCDMSPGKSISLETSYSDLRKVHNCNVIIIMRGDDNINLILSDFYDKQLSEFPFAVTETNVMAKTVSKGP